MRQFIAFTLFETKIFLRERLPLFFNLLIPVCAFGAALAFHLNDGPRGVERFVADYTPVFVALLMVLISIFTIANSVVLYRELGIFKRLLVTPLRAWDFVASMIIRGLISIGLVGLSMLAIATNFEGHVPEFNVIECVLGIAIAACGMFSMAYVIGSFVRKQRTLYSIGIILVYAFAFSSGAFPIAGAAPYQGWLSQISPSFYALSVIRAGWSGALLSDGAIVPIAALAALTLASILIARKRLVWTV